MFVILVTTVPFYGVKGDISTGTGRGQTVKDIFHLRGSAFNDRGEDNEDRAVYREPALVPLPYSRSLLSQRYEEQTNSLGTQCMFSCGAKHALNR